MRQFSKKEKFTIKLLIDGVNNSDAYLPINAYNDIFYREHVEFNANNMELVFYVPQGTIPEHKKMLDVYYEILEISLLIDYLQKEGLLYQISMPSVNQLTNVGGFDKSGLQGIKMSLDPKIGQILLNCMNSPIFVSQTLKDLVANNFISLEEYALLEAKKQTKNSFIAVALSIITIIISLIQTCTSDTENRNITYKSLINAIDSSQTTIEYKLNNIIDITKKISFQLRDTLNVNFINKKSIQGNKRKVINLNPCIKTVKLDTCRDTVVSKNKFIYSD